MPQVYRNGLDVEKIRSQVASPKGGTLSAANGMAWGY